MGIEYIEYIHPSQKKNVSFNGTFVVFLVGGFGGESVNGPKKNGGNL